MLVAHNEDVVDPGSGYDTHPHRDTEIVTWVLDGSLVHEDSHGNAGVIHPGLAQRMSAGSGVLHSERNDEPGAETPTRFVQMWLRPDEAGLDPSYQQHDLSDALALGTGLLPVVSGIAGLEAAVRIHTSGAALHVARLDAGETAGLPAAPRLHLFVARGSVDLEGAGRLDEGDAARLAVDGASHAHRHRACGGAGLAAPCYPLGLSTCSAPGLTVAVIGRSVCRSPSPYDVTGRSAEIDTSAPRSTSTSSSST